MTEEEWLRCPDPLEMLRILWVQGINLGDRKRRLFACACAKRITPLLADKRSREAIEVAELAADKVVSKKKLREAWQGADFAWAMANAQYNHWDNAAGYRPVSAAWAAVHTSARIVRERETVDAVLRARSGRTGKVVANTLSHYLRCVFGNPFHPVTLDPSCLTPQARTLAASIYEERAFDRLPILADLLQEAGCNQKEVLTHLRSGGEHVRGCWSLDLVLCKE